MNNIEFNLLCEKFAIPEEAKVRRNLLCLVINQIGDFNLIDSINSKNNGYLEIYTFCGSVNSKLYLAQIYFDINGKQKITHVRSANNDDFHKYFYERLESLEGEFLNQETIVSDNDNFGNSIEQSSQNITESNNVAQTELNYQVTKNYNFIEDTQGLGEQYPSQNIYKLVKSLLEQNDILSQLKSLKVISSQYQEKYILKNNVGEEAQISISYNSKDLISNLRFISFNDFSNKLKTIFDSLINKTIAQNLHLNFEENEDFNSLDEQFKGLIREISEKAKEEQININFKNKDTYCFRLNFVDEVESNLATLEFYHNKDNRITITPSNPKIVNESKLSKPFKEKIKKFLNQFFDDNKEDSDKDIDIDENKKEIDDLFFD